MSGYPESDYYLGTLRSAVVEATSSAIARWQPTDFQGELNKSLIMEKVDTALDLPLQSEDPSRDEAIYKDILKDIRDNGLKLWSPRPGPDAYLKSMIENKVTEAIDSVLVIDPDPRAPAPAPAPAL